MIFLAIIIPLIGTTIGSMFVILLKKNINHKWIMLLEGFAAGAMVYVVVSELIPSCNSIYGNIGLCIGFIIMMILDVLFS